MFNGTVKVKLTKPLKWEDREISFVELNFDKVTGSIINQCERATFQEGNLSGLVRSMSAEYCARMGALISGIPFRAMEKFSGEDYDRVWQTVGAYVSKQNPQEFYDQFVEGGDDKGFTEPAAEKPGKGSRA